MCFLRGSVYSFYDFFHFLFFDTQTEVGMHRAVTFTNSGKLCLFPRLKRDIYVCVCVSVYEESFPIYNFLYKEQVRLSLYVDSGSKTHW